jgi:hypothetical protein
MIYCILNTNKQFMEGNEDSMGISKKPIRRVEGSAKPLSMDKSGGNASSSGNGNDYRAKGNSNSKNNPGYIPTTYKPILPKNSLSNIEPKQLTKAILDNKEVNLPNKLYASGSVDTAPKRKYASMVDTQQMEDARNKAQRSLETYNSNSSLSFTPVAEYGNIREREVGAMQSQVGDSAENPIDIGDSSSAYTSSSESDCDDNVDTSSQNDVVENDTLENDVVQNDVVENDVVENDVVQSDVVENEVVQSDVVENDVVQKDVVEDNFKIIKSDEELISMIIENKPTENTAVQVTDGEQIKDITHKQFKIKVRDTGYFNTRDGVPTGVDRVKILNSSMFTPLITEHVARTLKASDDIYNTNTPNELFSYKVTSSYLEGI